MRKTLLFFLPLLFLFNYSYSQFGCTSGIVISDGYTVSGITTPGNGGTEDWNDPNPTSSCGANTSYWDDDVYLFEYTAGANDEEIEMDVFTRNSWCGVGIFTSCSGTALDACTGTSQGSSSSSNVTITATATITSGQTVYIAVGQWGTPNDLDFDVTSFSVTPLTSPPSCTTLSDPADGSTDVNVGTDLTWNAASGGPTGYKINMGTSMGGTDVLNNVDVGNVTTYDPGLLSYSTQYYVTITPYNANGDATGCTEESFTTEAAPPQGSVCTDPLSITSLPFSASDDTSNYGDDYSSSDEACSSSSYLNGDDVVYSYTPSADECVDITLTNTGTWVGVFVYSDCPFTTCVDSDTQSGGNPSLTGVNLTNGTTYYIVISTFPSPQSTAYDIDIDLCPACPDPTAQTESNITDVSVDLGWTENGSATTWDIEWGASGFTQGSGTMITGTTTNPHSLSGLSPETDYDWYVRSDCGSGMYSNWVGPNSFTTLGIPPANDDCSGATAFGTVPTDGTCVELLNQSTENATDSGVTPTGACTSNSGTEDDDVWFSFVASATEIILEATYVSGSSDVYWHVYEAPCGSTMNAILCTDTNSGGTLTGLTIGNTYYIKLYTWSSGVSTVQDICLKTPAAPPANDDCSGATAFGTVPTDGTCVELLNQTTESATDSGVTPTGACTSNSGTEDDDVWFSFVASATEIILEATYVSGNSDVYWHVYEAPCGSTMNAILCTDTNSGGTLTGLTIGNTYYIKLYTWSSGVSTVQDICLKTPPPPPANDECSNATSMVCGDSLVGETTDASTDNGDDTGCSMGVGVWYSFAGNDQDIVVTADPEAGFDIELSVSSSSDCVTFSNIDCEDSGFSGDAESITFSSVSGTTYYFYVAHYFGTTTGDFDISVECVPENNECASPVELANGSTGSISNISFDGTSSSGMSDGTCSFTGDGDLFYEITTDDDSNNSEDVIITAAPAAGLDVAIYVYDGCAGTLLGCKNDGGNGTEEVLTVTALSLKGKDKSGTRTQTIVVRIDHTGTGTVDLQAEGSALPIIIKSFNAVAIDDNNVIRWETTQEINNDYQILEYSNDGHNWSSLEVLEAKGNNIGATYEVVHKNPDNITYYRINAIDFDGTSSYSGVLNVIRNAEKDFMVHSIKPNPTNGLVQLGVDLPIEENIGLSVIDPTGKIIMQESIWMDAGSNVKDLDLTGFNTGIYILRIESSIGSTIRKIVKH